MSLTHIVLFVAGLVGLIYGARYLINGASRLATSFGIPPLVVGLTIVAFGTSAPELAAALQASFTGRPALALGNVIGSNIFNVLFVLGAAAIIAPIAVNSQVVKRDVPIMIGISLLMWVLALDNMFGRFDGILFVSLLFAYLVYVFRTTEEKDVLLPEGAEIPSDSSSDSSSRDDAKADRTSSTRMKNAGLVIVGLAMLTVGSRWLVDSSVEFARALGVSELIIGLTVIAIGTSLPEIATSVLASMRGKGDIAVGNVVGSNLFNILSVIGATATVSPHGIAVPNEALSFDLPIMIGVIVMTLPIFYTGLRISRLEGSLFLGYYVLYTVGLFLIARKSDDLDIYAAVMLWFVIPLTVLTLGFFYVRALLARYRERTT